MDAGMMFSLLPDAIFADFRGRAAKITMLMWGLIITPLPGPLAAFSPCRCHVDGMILPMPCAAAASIGCDYASDSFEGNISGIRFRRWGFSRLMLP